MDVVCRGDLDVVYPPPPFSMRAENVDPAAILRMNTECVAINSHDVLHSSKSMVFISLMRLTVDAPSYNNTRTWVAPLPVYYKPSIDIHLSTTPRYFRRCSHLARIIPSDFDIFRNNIL